MVIMYAFEKKLCLDTPQRRQVQRANMTNRCMADCLVAACLCEVEVGSAVMKKDSKGKRVMLLWQVRG